MFDEVLRIRPALDAAAAGRMEAGLVKRFDTATKRFGKGLRLFLTGGAIGASIGLVGSLFERLLNPIGKLEDRMKKLLDEGAELRDSGDRFHTTPGRMRVVEAFGSSVGVKPEELKTLMGKFADAVSTAKKELATGTTLSDSSRSVKNFVGDPDLARSFVNFLAGLRGGFEKTRRSAEISVFGGELHGAAKKLVDTPLAGQLQKLGNPSEAQLNGDALKSAALADQAALQRTRDGLASFHRAARNASQEALSFMLNREAVKQRAEDSRLGDMKNYEKLGKLSDKIEASIDFFQDKLVSLVGNTDKIVEKIEKSPHFDTSKNAIENAHPEFY